MTELQELVDSLLPGMGTLHDYIVPGLDSILLAKTRNGGCLRLFKMSRYQELFVTPHDHRYDFKAYVLAGAVENIKYSITTFSPPSTRATHAIVRYNKDTREWLPTTVNVVRAEPYSRTYGAGETYFMEHEEFHTIRFGDGAVVLMVEGPSQAECSRMLLPWRNGAVVDTFMWRPWMMRADA